MLRKSLLLQSDFMLEIEQIRKLINEHDNNFLVIFEYLKQFEEDKKQQFIQSNRKSIGF